MKIKRYAVITSDEELTDVTHLYESYTQAKIYALACEGKVMALTYTLENTELFWDFGRDEEKGGVDE